MTTQKKDELLKIIEPLVMHHLPKTANVWIDDSINLVFENKGKIAKMSYHGDDGWVYGIRKKKLMEIVESI